MGGVQLIGRRSERQRLDRLVRAVRAGESQALVLHGEPGIGKTALLDHVVEHAEGCRITRAAGVQSEMELAYAGLHQLCAPMLDRAEILPVPQRTALWTAFGLSAGPAPDRFFVGLAVLSLLSHEAERQPLLCVVDDQQWLDHASAQVLAFVARRLGAESVGLVFATRTPTADLTGLPELVVGGLSENEARELLDAVITGPIDAQVRDQLIAETRGNPLALLELPRGLSTEELAGGFGLPAAVPLAGSLEDTFRKRISALPDPSRRLLLLAASCPAGDLGLMWRAASLLGIDAEAATPAADAELADIGTQLRFRHPLVRAAAYRAGSAKERQDAHRALAEVIDPRIAPDRKAWHRAQATPGPDEAVATELEQSADRARARGGLAAAAAFLQRATTLTLDPTLQATRAVAAAQAKIQAGAYDAAQDLLKLAEAGPLSELQQAHTDLLKAQLAYVTNHGSDAPPLLLTAAKRLESIDPARSRTTYLEALTAAIFAGRFAPKGGDVLEVARAALAGPTARGEPRAADLLLDGTAAFYTDGYAAGLPKLRAALRDFRDREAGEEELHLHYLASITALRLWNADSWDAISARHLRVAREAGALSEVLLALTSRSYLLLFTGEVTAAASLIDELETVQEATGGGLTPYGRLWLTAFRGDDARATAVIDATHDDVVQRGEGVGLTFAEWAGAVLHNGHGRYPDALAAALRASAYEADPGSLVWVYPELVEAAVRAGKLEAAAEAYERLAAMTSASGTDWALGSRLGCARCCPPARRRNGSTWSPSPGWRGRGCASTWPAPTCCTASGYAVPAGGTRRASSCVPRTACSRRWAWPRSPNGLGASCGRAEARRANVRSPRRTSSPPRRPRSPGWRATGCPTRRSGRGCS